jgi:hypothetical protein
MKKWPAVLICSIIAASCFLGLDLFRWRLVNLLTVFLEPFVEIGAGVFILLVLVWSLIALVRQSLQHKVNSRVVYALVICLVALGLRVFVPFDLLVLKADFQIHLKRRTQIASEIVDGRWESKVTQRGGRGEFISLPGSDRRLSDGGEVAFWRAGNQGCVLFMTFRGILDSFSGFVYSSDDQPPPRDAFLGNPVQVEHWSPHWYWYASRN